MSVIMTTEKIESIMERGYLVEELHDKPLIDFLPAIFTRDLPVLTVWEEFFKSKGVPYFVEKFEKAGLTRRRLWKLAEAQY